MAWHLFFCVRHRWKKGLFFFFFFLLRCYIQLSGVIVAEQSLHSAQLPGFSNQGFKTFHTIRVHYTVL